MKSFMNFTLSDEQKILKEEARRFMEKEVAPVLESFSQDHLPSSEDIKLLLKKLIPFGYLGSVIPVEHGGSGLDYLTYGLLMEELEPSLFTMVEMQGHMARSVYFLGNEEQKRALLPSLLTAERIGCSCITEPNVGSDPSEIQTTAVPDGDHYVLNGNKIWITNGRFADIAFVLATVDPSKGRKGICRFIVDKAISPFESHPISTIGDSQIQDLAELFFKDCRVPKENILGVPGEALKDAFRALNVVRTVIAMGSIGLAQRAIEGSIRYAKTRHQFGKPIGQFQLIQAMLADMIAETDAARLLTYRALLELGEGTRGAKEASIAKFYATEIAVKVTSRAIQIHGAYGLSKDFAVERLFRIARMFTIPDGTTEINKLIVAREVLGMQAFV